jgi:hypothetical protein
MSPFIVIILTEVWNNVGLVTDSLSLWSHYYYYYYLFLIAGNLYPYKSLALFPTDGIILYYLLHFHPLPSAT